MQRKLVHHHNYIGHEINISLEKYPKSDREIYCRKLHKITEPLEKHCKDCPAFAGWIQGHGHDCVWEDVSTDMHMDIPFENKFDELERVTKLIEDGTLDRKIYDSSKWIYKRSDDNKSRFALGTKGNKTLICFGANPSVAAPEATDPTIKNVTAFATKNGYDSYIMLNLYPQRATDPKNMDKDRNDEYHLQNLKAIKEIFEVLQSEQEDINILASWGNLIDENDYLKSCFTAIVKLSKDYKCNWICLGKTKYHHPKHPSRLSYETKLIPFDIDSYNNLITDCFTDVLAVPSVYQFLNPQASSKVELNVLIEYSIEISEASHDE